MDSIKYRKELIPLTDPDEFGLRDWAVIITDTDSGERHSKSCYGSLDVAEAVAACLINKLMEVPDGALE